MKRPPPNTDHLLVGARYEIIWQIEGVHRKPRRSVMKYLGTLPNGHLSFDLRPIAGTQDLEPQHIIGIRATSAELSGPMVMH